ncbi:MAG: cysteine peptidase family C39 domain-containing protein, partial [Eikenella corrodens]
MLIRFQVASWITEKVYPFIVHVLKEGKLLHYYVVTGQDKHTIHIA